MIVRRSAAGYDAASRAAARKYSGISTGVQ